MVGVACSHEPRAALQRSGRASEARALVRPVYESFDEGHDTADLTAARSLLD